MSLIPRIRSLFVDLFGSTACGASQGTSSARSLPFLAASSTNERSERDNHIGQPVHDQVVVSQTRVFVGSLGWPDAADGRDHAVGEGSVPHWRLDRMPTGSSVRSGDRAACPAIGVLGRCRGRCRGPPQVDWRLWCAWKGGWLWHHRGGTCLSCGKRAVRMVFAPSEQTSRRRRHVRSGMSG